MCGAAYYFKYNFLKFTYQYFLLSSNWYVPFMYHEFDYKFEKLTLDNTR